MKPKKAAAKAAKVKPEAVTAPVNAKESRLFRVWEPLHEIGAREIRAAEPTAAALDFCATVYPEKDGNRCASVNMSESDILGRVRVFMTNNKPVPYLFAEEVK